MSRRLLIIGIAIICLLIWNGRVLADVNTFSCEARIYKEKAEFLFRGQIDQKTWAWFLPTTPPDTQEYRWEATIPVTANENYEVGFSLFKRSNSPQTGNFIELLKAGQNSVFHLIGERGTLISEAFARDNPAVSVQGTDLLVMISDEKTYKLLFANKPKHVHFFSKSPYFKNTKKCTATVEYNNK